MIERAIGELRRELDSEVFQLAERLDILEAAIADERADRREANRDIRDQADDIFRRVSELDSELEARK